MHSLLSYLLHNPPLQAHLQAVYTENLSLHVAHTFEGRMHELVPAAEATQTPLCWLPGNGIAYAITPTCSLLAPDTDALCFHCRPAVAGLQLGRSRTLVLQSV